ncbi:anti-sigma factor, partial [Saccharothrix hoggarensis]
ADGWVRLRAVVAGVDPGERCRLVVTDVRGRRHVAGGWVASRGGGDTALAGAVLVDVDDVAAIGVVTEDGRTLVAGATR